MSCFADGEELERELVACLTAFLGSADGARATEAARGLGDQARLTLHTVAPEAVVSVDFYAGSVSLDVLADANVEITLEADALHDILLGRLDPVQISRLYETNRLAFAGAAVDLAALVLLAGPLQPHYPASLRRRGRQDLLETPAPPTAAVWTAGEEPPTRMIDERRVWQRPRRRAASA